METGFYSTYLLLIAVVIVSLKGFNDREFVEKYLFIPYDVKHHGEWYRFFTHAFLHGDTGHLFFNGFTLFNFGPFLEDYLAFKYGSLGQMVFWLFILLSLVASSSISYWRHKDNSSYRSLGISGAVSSVLFAFILIAPTAELSIMFLPIPIPAYLFGAIYLAYEIYSDRNRRTAIAHDAHIAGAVFGILFILITNIELVIHNFNRLFS
jgi:membrane associated rhomboid family serine protease